MNIENALYVEMSEEFEKLADLEVGTDKHKAAVGDLTALMDRAIELEKLEAAAKEQEMRLEQQKKDDIDKIVKNVIATLGVVVPAVLTIWGTTKSLKFEETGTVTTIMGRGFIQKLLPKK